MVYTVTFNPSLDYVVQVKNFRGDAVNRTTSEAVYAGGKGNNVAVVISNLGIKSRALGFRAGFTGAAMEQLLRDYGCDTDFIPLDEGMTRINVKVKAEEEFEINGQGPKIPEQKSSSCWKRRTRLEKRMCLYCPAVFLIRCRMICMSGSCAAWMAEGCGLRWTQHRIYCLRC